MKLAYMIEEHLMTIPGWQLAAYAAAWFLFAYFFPEMFGV